MYKTFLSSFIVFLLLTSASEVNAQQNKQTKTILIIFGLAPNQPAYIPLLKGIREKLDEEFYENYNFHMEYLNLRRYENDNFPNELFESLNKKYREIHIDLLICIGINPVPTIKKFAERYLLELPTISMDLDFSDYGFVQDMRLNNVTTIVNMNIDPAKSIAFGIKLFPETSSVYFISGVMQLDKFYLSSSREWAEKNLLDKKITYVTDLKMQDILDKVRRLPKKSIVFVGSFSLDADSIEYNNPEAIRLISSQSNAPVFGYSDLGFGEGPIGGYIASFEKVGQFMGKAAVKILNGADPNSFKITEQDYYEYVFDWRQLKRWNLLKSDLIPAGSTIMHENISFIDRYKWIGGVVLLFLVLQTLLIANLIRLNRNQKLMTTKIIESENRYREFLHEDRSLRLGQLTASLSHELNQPLTAILSNAQAGINFINSNEATPDLLKQIFQKIVDNDKRGASILSSIRGMMKLEHREKGKVNLNDLINEVLVVIQGEANRYNTRLNSELTGKTVYVLGDRIQIQQVLLNFLLNATQSMEKIDASSREITVSSTIKDSEVIVSVSDKGEGIDEATKDKLFKPFITSKKEGTGIGLVICRSIIEDHGGKIWAENKPDGGAKFSFSLKMLEDGKSR
ncbi:MAG: HAMP domain-containing histidine kinase [Ignavibacteriaceae bacterium]|nr:HAMP domain-containing histidine kinase [Ignavibacteriaceae bacterium]